MWSDTLPPAIAFTLGDKPTGKGQRYANELTALSRCRSHCRASSIMAAYNRRREMRDLLLLLFGDETATKATK